MVLWKTQVNTACQFFKCTGGLQIDSLKHWMHLLLGGFTDPPLVLEWKFYCIWLKRISTLILVGLLSRASSLGLLFLGSRILVLYCTSSNACLALWFTTQLWLSSHPGSPGSGHTQLWERHTVLHPHLEKAANVPSGLAGPVLALPMPPLVLILRSHFTAPLFCRPEGHLSAVPILISDSASAISLAPKQIQLALCFPSAWPWHWGKKQRNAGWTKRWRNKADCLLSCFPMWFPETYCNKKQREPACHLVLISNFKRRFWKHLSRLC